jgi:hypothetical protein
MQSRERNKYSLKMQIVALAAIALASAMALIEWLNQEPAPTCRQIKPSEFQTSVRNGREINTIDLRKIPAGGCIEINTGGSHN